MCAIAAVLSIMTRASGREQPEESPAPVGG